MDFVTEEQLAAGLDTIRAAPLDGGRLELVVRRPALGEREVMAEGVLDTGLGLVGDTWSERPSRRMPDGLPHPEMQLNLMNSRVTALIAGDRDRWPLAGDQLYVDLDLSVQALPGGTRLAIGDAVVEITDIPHLGCAKFTRRFGLAAHHFVNSEQGKELRLRGVNAKVVVGGTVRPGDTIDRVAPSTP